MENQELEQLKSAEDIAGFGSFTWDLDTDEMTWSSGPYKMLGIEENGAQPPSLALLQSMTREDVRDRVIAEAKVSADGGLPYQAEYPIVPDHAEGVTMWIRIKGDRVTVHGRPSVVGVMLDITEQTTAKVQAQQLSDQLLDALDRSQDLIELMRKAAAFEKR